MRKSRIVGLALALTMGLSSASALTGCGKGTKKDSIVIMTEALSGLFNPFYATSGTDMDVVGMTQIGMLATDDNGKPQTGDDLPTVSKAFDYQINDLGGDKKETVYTFVIKNGLKFSDGEPLTMNDVLFNMYEYLDPVYTGSSTMYSIKIKGLANYRTQTYNAENAEEDISRESLAAARERRLELYTLYTEKGVREGTENSYSFNETQMKAAIKEWDVSDGYKQAVATSQEIAEKGEDYFRNILLGDYQLTLDTFRKELDGDWLAAQESFDTTTEPYKEHADKLKSEAFRFLLYEGVIKPVYAKIPGTSRDDKTKILSFDNESAATTYPDKDKAIAKVYGDTIRYNLHDILSYWGTAGTLLTQYAAEARSIILKEKSSGDAIKNIEGIVSLGHTTEETEVTVKGTTYKVAHKHDEKGRPVNADEYDVLRITVDGTDPKAIYNFGFTVAPAHYYTADATHPNGREIDIANDKFGVEFASADFQSKVIQSQQHVEIPVGAGPYKATDANNSDNPTGAAFNASNIVYYKANENFMFPVKAPKLRMQVVSSTNAIDALQSGAVDYITPQFTKSNADRLNSLASKGIEQLHGWQLGYGYIGINAGKVPNIHIRRAIMAAMDTALASEYYFAGTCVPNNWPMSTQSWAYPWNDQKTSGKANGHDYTQYTSDKNADTIIDRELAEVGDDPDVNKKIRFTIAGASITEHPTYSVFKKAAETLNKKGFDIEVKADSQALTKLSTGSLEVWAAAWGSTVDPDMYQVYHKNSSATSVYSWGYREIKADKARYSEEFAIISELSDIIDDARSMMDENERKPLYEQAMKLVLDLAVELPVYQRQTLYAYNSKTIKGLTVKGEGGLINSYSSPLERVWELELI